jgi:hypothetical protein
LTETEKKDIVLSTVAREAPVTVHFKDCDEAETIRAKPVTELESIKTKWEI